MRRLLLAAGVVAVLVCAALWINTRERSDPHRKARPGPRGAKPVAPAADSEDGDGEPWGGLGAAVDGAKEPNAKDLRRTGKTVRIPAAAGEFTREVMSRLVTTTRKILATAAKLEGEGKLAEALEQYELVPFLAANAYFDVDDLFERNNLDMDDVRGHIRRLKKRLDK